MFLREIHNPLEQNSSFFLFGPRGTGKTTWLKTQLDSYLMFDLLDKGLYRELLAKPEYLEKLIPSKTNTWIVIDEIQKIPELLDVVHRLIELYGLKFILTGSSARSLRKKGVNLLAGRAITYHMYPLTINELGNSFSLEKALYKGFLPTAWGYNSAENYLNSYITTYLTEEVLQEGLSRNLSVFSRFLEAASFSQASILNMSHIARECGIDRKTVENYFSILDDMLLAYRLPVFSRRAKRDLITGVKFYYFDVGIFRTFRPRGPLDIDSEIGGIALETIVLQELIAQNEYHNLKFSIYFWRTSRGHEVDFILYGEKGFYAIEVKASSRISKSSFSGLKTFQSDYPEAKCILFYTGNRKEFHDNIEVIPFNEFSEWIKNGLLKLSLK